MSDHDSSSRTRQQTNSRMMKTTRRGRPYAKDTHDLFATLIVSLRLTTHRQFFRTYHNSFTTDEAAENLSALKFSQSNRAPDPREPSRVVTTTTTTTFSMNRDMAKGICQHFMDARLIENATDLQSGVFKDKGVYQLTPKGLHILERFITKNGINAEHLLKVFASQPICMKLLHLERRAHDDELLINRPILEVIFRRFCGRQPNYLPGMGSRPDSSSGKPSTPEGVASPKVPAPRSSGSPTRSGGAFGSFDATMGIGVQDIIEKVKGRKQPVRIKHVFPAISVLDWLVDYTTICGRDEAAEIAAHFQRLAFITLARDTSSKREGEDDSTVIARGEDGIGRVSEGEFKCHYKCMYGLTDRGRAIARWAGYSLPLQNDPTGTVDSRSSQSANAPPQLNASSSEVNLSQPPLPQAQNHQHQPYPSTQQQQQHHNDSNNNNDIESLRSQSDSVANEGSSRHQPRDSFSTRPSSEQSSSTPASKSVSAVPFKSSNYAANSAAAAAAAAANNSQQQDQAGPKSPHSTSRDAPFVPFIKPSAAEKLRNDYISRGGPANQGNDAFHSPHNARDSNTNRLKQVLEEPALRSLFRDFLKQNFCEENLSFWLDVQDFKRRFHTTSSAVAVRPGDSSEGGASGSGSTGRSRVRRGLFNRASSSLNRSDTARNGGDSSDGGGSGSGSKSTSKKKVDPNVTQGVTAMEKHQQDLIAMAFVIYNTYLAQASPCELNIEHNLRMELVTYMNRVLKDAKASAGEGGVQTVRAKDLQRRNSQDSSSTASFRRGVFPGSSSDDGGLAAALAGPPPSDGGRGGGNSTNTNAVGSSQDSAGPNLAGGLFRRGGNAATGAGASGASSMTASAAPAPMSVEERKSTVQASMPRYPLHASQLQTMVRLYERIQDHIFRLMATDSVPRFIKDSRFLGLVKSVAEYTEALESGRLDPNDVAGPAISQNVVDAMELGIISGATRGGGVGGGGASGSHAWNGAAAATMATQRPTAVGGSGGSTWDE